LFYNNFHIENHGFGAAGWQGNAKR
jgi:hypothetical protein